MLSCAITLSCICLAFFLSTEHCGLFLNTLSGRFSSPGYPTGYPYNAKCVWEIKVPKGYFIKLKFEYVFLFFFSSCSMSYKMLLTEKKNKAEVCSIQRQLNIHAMSTFTFFGTVLSILSSKKPRL